MKKIKIICEETYAESIGCKQLVNGIFKVLKKRRLGFEFALQISDFQPTDMVCLVGISNIWIERAVGLCNEQDVFPIVLSNRSLKQVNGKYHFICPDEKRMLETLKVNFAAAGRNKLAVYGVNRAVDSDMDKMAILLEIVDDSGKVYWNTGNLESCFRAFLPQAKAYDAVICVNGYAALSLAKKLGKECPEVLDTLVIVSFEEALQHSKYNQWISLVDLQLESYGAAAVALSEMARQNKDISAITIEMKCKVCEIPPKGCADTLNESSGAGSFLPYEDPEIISMAKIEHLMRDADDLDHHIIAMLLSNAKYSEIADSCYMTEGNVKYRVKKYMSICNCKTKKELLELLQEYLQ